MRDLRDMTHNQRRRFPEMDARIGANLRKLRRSQRISLEATAQAVGVTYQQMSKYEAGRDRLSLAMAVRLCAFLGASVGALVAEAVEGEGDG